MMFNRAVTPQLVSVLITALTIVGCGNKPDHLLGSMRAPLHLLEPVDVDRDYLSVSNTGELGLLENREHDGLIVLPPKGGNAGAMSKGIVAPESQPAAILIDVTQGMESEGTDTKAVIKDICGAPTWRKVDPWTIPERYVVSLRIHVADSDRVFSGSGALIGSRCILTAGHNLHNVDLPGKGWVTRVEVYAGRNGSKCAVMTSSSNFRSLEGWVNGDQTSNDFDIGAIILPDDRIFNWAQGHFGIDPAGSVDDVKLLGYPWARGNAEMEGRPYESQGRATTNGRTLQYLLDSYAGHSGSPLFPSASRSLVGVHVSGGCPNKSIRINQDLMGRILEWTEL